MIQKKGIIRLTVLSFVIGLLACGSDDLLSAFTPPTLTPTFVMARFTTATPTSMPTTPLPITPTEPATATPAATPIPEISPTITDDASDTETPATGDDNPDETVLESPLASPTSTSTSPPPTAIPTETPVPTPAAMSGRITFSIDDGGGHFDIWAVELPDDEPFQIIQRARQPSFSKDGRLLVNLENSPRGNHLGLLDSNYAWLGEISESPYDSFPFWNPDSNLYVFSNPQLLFDPNTGDPLPHVFMPCSMRPPWEEDEVKCQDIKSWGKVAIGEYPVWTDDNRIAYFDFTGEDGIYVVSGVLSLWESGSVGQPQLLVKCNGRPNDTQGYQVYFSAGSIDQNWEAYMIDLDGTNLVNLSNSPTSQDGLPTVSPDGNWVAFLSDRDGQWGIWVMPRTGGEPKKIVDYSKINTSPVLWGEGDRHWTFDRISWGP